MTADNQRLVIAVMQGWTGDNTQLYRLAIKADNKLKKLIQLIEIINPEGLEEAITETVKNYCATALNEWRNDNLNQQIQ